MRPTLLATPRSGCAKRLQWRPQSDRALVGRGRRPRLAPYQLARLSSTDRHRLGEVLDTQIGPKLLGAVDVHLAARVIKSQPVPRAAELLGALDAQQAVKILRRFQHDLRDALLSAMPIERAKAPRSMLLWPPDSVAAHMSTEPLTLGPTTTAGQAVEQIRDRISNLHMDADAANCVYVTGPEQQLLGAVPFRSLVIARADRAVADLIEDEVVTVGPLTEAEHAAHLFVNRRLEELADRRLLGVLTEDQAVNIREDETTEDAEKQGGSTPSRCRTCVPRRGGSGGRGSSGCWCCSLPRPTPGRCCGRSKTRWRPS